MSQEELPFLSILVSRYRDGYARVDIRRGHLGRPLVLRTGSEEVQHLLEAVVALEESGLEEEKRVNTNRLMGFSEALLYLKSGSAVTRKNWNGKGQYLRLQVPDENSKMTLPYIYITTVGGERVPWLASQTDLLSNDWQLYEE